MGLGDNMTPPNMYTLRAAFFTRDKGYWLYALRHALNAHQCRLPKHLDIISYSSSYYQSVFSDVKCICCILNDVKGDPKTVIAIYDWVIRVLIS